MEAIYIDCQAMERLYKHHAVRTVGMKVTEYDDAKYFDTVQIDCDDKEFIIYEDGKKTHHIGFPQLYTYVSSETHKEVLVKNARDEYIRIKCWDGPITVDE